MSEDFTCQAGGPWTFAGETSQSQNAMCCRAFSQLGSAPSGKPAFRMQNESRNPCAACGCLFICLFLLSPHGASIQLRYIQIKTKQRTEVGVPHPALLDAGAGFPFHTQTCWNFLCRNLLPAYSPRRNIWRVPLSLLLPKLFCSNLSRVLTKHLQAARP